MNRRISFISFILFICILLSTPCLSVYATPSQPQERMLADIILEQTDPSLYPYLQSAIDNSLLPGYQIEGKAIFTYYSQYNIEEPDKSLDACIERSKDLRWTPYFFILDGTQCFVLEHIREGKVNYEYEAQSEWDFLRTMLLETAAVTEICGAPRTITGVTCFDTHDGYVVYFETTEGIFIRHYGHWYENPKTEEGPRYTPKDYTFEDFVYYTNCFAEWNKKDAYHCPICASFSGYMSEGMPDPIPLAAKNDAISPYVWIVIGACGVVLISGVAAGILLYRRRRRCAS